VEEEGEGEGEEEDKQLGRQVDGAVDVPAVVRRGGCSGRCPETHCRRLHQHPLCLLRCQPGFRLHKPLSSGRMMTTMTPTARTTMLVTTMRRTSLSLQLQSDEVGEYNGWRLHELPHYSSSVVQGAYASSR